MLLNGATTGMMLADLGAEVIKVEDPSLGDYLRIEDTYHLHLHANKSKRSIALNLKRPEGREIFYRLLERTDVFVTNAVADRNARLGISYANLRSRKPDIIYCQNTGFGATGPYAELPVHGQMMDAVAGATPVAVGADGLTWPAQDGPRRVLTMSAAGEATTAGAVYAALHIAAALYRRQQTGEGAYLDVSSADAAIASAWTAAATLINRPEQAASRQANFANLARYQWYETADRRFMLFCPEENKFWASFCTLVGRADLITREQGVELRRELSDIFRTRTAGQWVAFALEHRLPLGPSYSSVDEVREDAQIQHRGVFRPAVHPERGPFAYIAQPVIVDGDPRRGRSPAPAPALGEHTDAVLAELGINREQIDELAASGVTKAAQRVDYISQNIY
jgi:formyl-CoA transferase